MRFRNLPEFLRWHAGTVLAVVAWCIVAGVALLLWLMYHEDLAAWIMGTAVLIAALTHLVVGRVLYEQAESARPDQLSPAADYDDYDDELPVKPGIRSAILSEVTRGVLAFNPPSEMRQGITERMEVGIARTDELRDALLAELEGRGQVQHQEVPTSSFMSVQLSGKAFGIEPMTKLVEQVVEPTARWQFDVTPLRRGIQTLHLSVSYRIEVFGTSHSGFKAVPVVERDIRVRVNVGYVVAHNRKWLVTTAVAVAAAAGTIAAVFH